MAALYPIPVSFSIEPRALPLKPEPGRNPTAGRHLIPVTVEWGWPANDR
jgi:hypothetical protein